MPSADGLAVRAAAWVLAAATTGLFGGCSPPDAVDGGPPFVDRTEEAGLSYQQALDHRAEYSWYTDRNLTFASYYTGGVAVADIDGDEWPDIIVTRLHDSPIYFHNRGDGRFEDWTVRAGLDVDDLQAVGVAVGDIDNDDDPDLYFTSIGTARFYLFVNQGDGIFVEEGIERGAAIDDDAERQGFSAAFGDYDRDGFLDLFVCEWQAGSSSPTRPSHTRLLHNRGGERSELAGFYEDRTLAAGIDLYRDEPSPVGVHAFAANFADMDNDGYPDLLIAADFRTSRLFWNRGDGTFEDGTVAAGVGTDTHGMGSAIGDYDGDGHLDWFVTSIACPDENPLCTAVGAGNRLYRNLGSRVFEDRTDFAGVRDGGWGWGATFLDYDSDGLLDLLMVNGNTEPGQTLFYGSDPSRLWQNRGDGTFDDSLASFEDRSDARGIATLDFDRDGDLDVFVVRHHEGGRLFENRSRDNRSAGPYLRVRLRGNRGNRDAYGARIRVRREDGIEQIRELRGGSNFLGQDEPVAHFGFARAYRGRVRVEVVWPTPGGRLETVMDAVELNQELSLQEP